jgi:hypothetical protein
LVRIFLTRFYLKLDVKIDKIDKFLKTNTFAILLKVVVSITLGEFAKQENWGFSQK